MVGKIYITSNGYDPEHGKHINDPYLDGEPSLGACRPDIRRVLKPDDFVFVITGGLPQLPIIPQFILCGFQVSEKIHAVEAYERFPKQRLCKTQNGQIRGNIIVNEFGNQHFLDRHEGGRKFESRIENFIVGKNLIMPCTPAEIELAREQTMEILCRVVGKLGSKPFELIGRSAKNLSERQVEMLLDWLFSLKNKDRTEKLQLSEILAAKTTLQAKY